MVLAATLSMLRYIGGSDDKDFVDRLHSYFTCNILIALSILVSFKQFGGKPVECLVPDMFSSSWEQYAENYCWAQDTYFVSLHQPVSGLGEMEKRERKISYYQWVPFFLLLEAACFRLPSLLWQYMSGHSGIKITEIVKLSSDPNNIKPDIKAANIKSLTMHLQGALRFHKRLQKRQIRPHKCFLLCNLPYSAFFVTAMYIITKLFYLINVTLQLLLMNKFLETDRYPWYGLGAVYELLNGVTWKESGVFPRVSLCDFDVRVMGHTQNHTIQCVLVINIFNEKIFIFLWFWFTGLLVFTLGSFLYWLTVAVIPLPSKRFIMRHLEMSDMPFDPTDPKTENDVDQFIKSYLRSDGVFVLRMLTLQSGVIFGTDLTVSLWKAYYGTEHLKRSNSVPGKREGPMMAGGGGSRDDLAGEKKAFEWTTPIRVPFTWNNDSGAKMIPPSNDIELRQRRAGADGIPLIDNPLKPTGSVRGGRDAVGERIRLIPPPAPPPDFMRHVALVRGGENAHIDDPNQMAITRARNSQPGSPRFRV